MEDLAGRLAEVFGAKPRAHWGAVFADVDACGTPVLALDELGGNVHLRERGTVVRDGLDTRSMLTEADLSTAEVDALVAAGTVHTCE